MERLWQIYSRVECGVLSMVGKLKEGSLPHSLLDHRLTVAVIAFSKVVGGFFPPNSCVDHVPRAIPQQTHGFSVAAITVSGIWMTPTVMWPC